MTVYVRGSKGRAPATIPQEKRPVPVLDLQLPRLQNLAVLTAQDRQEHPVLEFLLHGPPIDVEVAGVGEFGPFSRTSFHQAFSAAMIPM